MQHYITLWPSMITIPTRDSTSTKTSTALSSVQHNNLGWALHLIRWLVAHSFADPFDWHVVAAVLSTVSPVFIGPLWEQRRSGSITTAAAATTTANDTGSAHSTSCHLPHIRVSSWNGCCIS